MNAASCNDTSTSNAVCVVDRSRTDTECGCTTTNPSNPPDDTPRRKTLSCAGIVGLLCVLGCGAGPLAIGDVASATGALSAKAWIIATGLLIVAVVYAYRRRTGRRGC